MSQIVIQSTEKLIIKRIGICIAAAVLVALAPFTASAHILAMVNYESKTEEGLHAHGTNATRTAARPLTHGECPLLAELGLSPISD